MSARENVALVGFMGSGKSSIGRLIARRLDWRFFDMDQWVVQKNGREIGAIFESDGEEFFRAQERLALESLRDENHCVIATGGGIVTQARNVELLREIGMVVWLSASEETILKRVSRNTKRPLLQTANPRETISALLKERRPSYEAAANFQIDTSDTPQAEVADAVITAVRQYFGG